MSEDNTDTLTFEIELDENVREEVSEQTKSMVCEIELATTQTRVQKIEMDWGDQTRQRHRGGYRSNVSGAIYTGPQLKGRVEPRPRVGLQAPPFRATTIDGNSVDLGALHGKKVWLIFYRHATCPLSGLHLSILNRHYPALKEAGLEVIAVFDSRVLDFYQPGKIKFIRFPILADPDKKLYRLYATRSSFFAILSFSVLSYFFMALLKGFKRGKTERGFGQLPSSFLIDANGIIREIYHGKNASDFLSWSNVRRFIGQR